MLKRFATIALCALLIVGAAAPALADTGALDRALSRWLSTYPDVRFTAGLKLNAMLPYRDDTIALLNASLGNVSLNAALRTVEGGDETRASLMLHGQALLHFAEVESGGAYSLTTTLLPNRTLTSETVSPLDLLTESPPEADAASAAEATQTGKNSVSGSDIASAFSALDAVGELAERYPALVAGITPITEEKRANYTIKGIGAGRWSRVARLTQEQSAALQDDIRAVLACGMDDRYRSEVAQMTFDKGFVIALYRNIDKKDICLYMKGTATYADGQKRKLLWQWAFTNNGLKRKDTFKIEAARQSGTADSRIVAATVTQEGKSDAFGISGKVETTLKRAKVTDKSTVRIELSGKQDASLAMTCKGTVSQELATTTGETTQKVADSAAVDLLLTPDGDGATLSGTVTRTQTADKTVTSELLITFQPAAQPVGEADAGQPADSAPPADAVDTAPETEPASSLDKLADELAAPDTAEDTDAQSDYLVGTLPVGLKTFATPQGMTTVALDKITRAQRQALLDEMAQRLAGRLLAAMAALPEADTAILRDAMTEQDAAALLSLLSTY
jgi:hypothetical protein